MAICRGCGADVLRTCARYGPSMELLSEICPQCAPDQFCGVKVTAPSDKKIWDGYEVEPDRYSSPDAENVVHASDELRQDIWDEFNRDPDAEAVQKKRATRRTEPLSASEIERAKSWGEKVLRPLLEEVNSNAATP